MSFDEPTRRMNPDPSSRRRHDDDAPTTRMPGPLDLAGPSPASGDDATDVLSLDELFEGQPPAQSGPDAAAVSAPAGPDVPAGADAPTWTAMPIVAVRSEPLRHEPGRGGTDADEAPPSTSRSDLRRRVQTDAITAWDGLVRRSRAWITADDNALMLMTALAAIILIVVVAALSS